MNEKELEEKINQLEYVASNLENQVYSLKAEIRKLNDEKARLEMGKNNQAHQVQPDYQQQVNYQQQAGYQQQPIYQQSSDQARYSGGQYGGSGVDIQQSGYEYGTSINIVNSGKEKDFEKWFGKNMMSVVASVLIFVSIIIFSTVFYPNLTDEIKVVAMYILSFGIFGFGYLGVRKNKKDSFKIGVMACGLGCLFISLLITKIHFEMLNDSQFMVGTFLWVILTIYLTRFSNNLFHVVGQIGVVIAVVESINSFIITSREHLQPTEYVYDISTVYVILVLFVLSQIIFVATNKRNIYSVIADYLVLLVGIYEFFLNDARFSFNEKMYYSIITLIIVCVLAYILYANDENLIVVNVIASLAFIVLLSFSVITLIGGELSINETLNVLAIIIFVYNMIFAFRYKHENSWITFLKVVLSLLTLLTACFSLGLISFVILMAYVLVFAFMGFARNDRAYQWVTLCAPLFFSYDSKPLPSLICISIVCFGVILLMAKYKKSYKQVYKAIIHVEFLFYFTMMFELLGDSLNIERAYLSLIKYIIVSACSVIAMKTDYGRSFVDQSEEDNFQICCQVINLIIMYSGLMHILRYNQNAYVHIMYIIIVLMLFSVNSISLFEDYKSNWVHAYVGFKYTVLLLVVLKSYSVETVACNVFAFAFALLCILLGFKIYKKGIRIYGLVLAMLYVVKMLLVDVAYSSPVGIAIGLLLAGIICFTISAIYNYAEDKILK